MKTTYYLVLAAVVAAAGVTVYARLPGGEKQAPSVPLSADARDVRRLELPPVALPPDDTPGDPMLIAPRGANLPLPLPVPAPSAPDLPPVTPTAGALPPLPLPSVPAMPEAPKPVAPPALPVPPALPKAELPALPVPPAPKPDALPLPPLPTMPSAPVAMPELPAVPPMPAVPPALPPVAKPELPAPVPPAPKPEVALPPAVPPMPVQPPAPKPELNLLPPVTPAPLPPAPKPDAPLVPPMPVQPPAPKPDAPLPPVVQPALQPLPRSQPVVQPEVPAPVQLQPLPRPQPLPPVTTPAPSAPTGSLDPKPQPLPPRVEPQPVLGPPPGTKFVLLKGDRLIECSSAAPNGDVWVVRQGALDRALPKGEVQFVGDSRDAIYKHVLGRVKADDAGARLQVARWCMYVGMREQALAEAREVQKLDPKNGTAADMIRSLELSLKQFPPADQPKMSAPPQPVYPVDLRPAVPPMATPVVPVVPRPAAPPIPPALEPDLDVPAAAARAFPGLALAVLQQKCAECHARADYTGSFKLARVDLERPSERAVRDNLRAAVAQLSADGEHPLLEKARTAHGEMPRPALSHLDASYKSLSAWVASARVAGAKPVPPAAPTAPVGVPQLLPPAVPVSKPVGDPLLPPVPPPGAFGAALPPKPPVAPGTGDEFAPAGYNRELPK
jgi:mono/diheme cytochrome c family protein